MTDTSTFSALVDDAISRSKRKDRTADIVSYARSTMRECQVLAFFEQDMIEDSLTVDQLPFQWSRPFRLRTILAAKPQEVFSRRDKKRWFKNRPPGQMVRDLDYYMYLSGDTYIFTGTELATADVIDIAYFTYARKFVYYATADRPASFDDETEAWTYHADYDDTTTTQATARELVTNWLLRQWYDLLLEGTLAKIFKQVGDERSRTAFSLYKSQQKDLLGSERVILLNDQHDENG